jgi:hypothetical protein
MSTSTLCASTGPGGLPRVAGPVASKTKASGVDLDGVSGKSRRCARAQQLKTDSKGLQTNDRIQIIKTRAGLVEKLVAMDERTNNLKRQSQFQTVLLGILDDLVP